MIASRGEPVYMWSGRTQIAYSTLNEYIRGVRPIPHHHLLKLCDALGVEPEDIIGLNSEHAH